MDSILIILRSLLMNSSTYSDESLNKLIIVAAMIVQNEMVFETTYTVDIVNTTITPDPEDNTFILFTAYKAAILLLQAETRTYSSQSVKILDGPSSIDLSGMSKDMKSVLDSIIAQYDKMRRDFTIGKFGYSVTTPTTTCYYSPDEFY